MRDKFFENDKLPNDCTGPLGIIKNALRKFEWMPPACRQRQVKK